jgi:hypothetical protein
MGPYYDKATFSARALAPGDWQRMAIMNLSLTGSFGLDRQAGHADSGLTPIRRLWAALRRRRWQRARPFVHLSDHLRRDVGLPPLDGGGFCR